MEEPMLHDLVRWKALRALPKAGRRLNISRALHKAKVLYAKKKVPYVLENFERLEKEGGPQKVKRLLDSKSTADEIIKFLCTFRGIGPKYARNMMMDGYHPKFRDSVAIDQRIQKILKEVGQPLGTDYEEAERFLLGVAKTVRLKGWELDRLLFSYTDKVLARLRRSAGLTATPPACRPRI